MENPVEQTTREELITTLKEQAERLKGKLSELSPNQLVMIDGLMDGLADLDDQFISDDDLEDIKAALDRLEKSPADEEE